MKTRIIALTALLGLLLSAAAWAAADAPKQPANSTASRDLPTVESLTAENAGLRQQVASLTEQIAVLRFQRDATAAEFAKVQLDGQIPSLIEQYRKQAAQGEMK